jgi:hypothetical protein
MSNDDLEGRIRAIEAILLELEKITPDVIEAASGWSAFSTFLRLGPALFTARLTAPPVSGPLL